MNPFTSVYHFLTLSFIDWNGYWPLSHPALWLSFRYHPIILSTLSSHRYEVWPQGTFFHKEAFCPFQYGQEQASGSFLGATVMNVVPHYQVCAWETQSCRWPHPSWPYPLIFFLALADIWNYGIDLLMRSFSLSLLKCNLYRYSAHCLSNEWIKSGMVNVWVDEWMGGWLIG